MALVSDFQATLQHPAAFERLIIASEHCVPSTRMWFTSNSIYWRAIDTTSTVMLSVRLSASAFARCTLRTTPFALGVQFAGLVKILKVMRLRECESLEICAARESGRIQLSAVCGGRTSSFSLTTLNLTCVLQEPPDGAEDEAGEYPYALNVRTEWVTDIKKMVEGAEAANVRFTVPKSFAGNFYLGAEAIASQREATAWLERRAELGSRQLVERVVRVGRVSARSPVLKMVLFSKFVAGSACSNRAEVCG